MATLHFELLDFLEGAITRLVPISNGRGGYTYKRLTFLPQTHYTTDDPAFADFIKGNVGDVREKSVKTADLEAKLKAANVPYEISKCGSCPSAVAKLIYNPFTVKEDD